MRTKFDRLRSRTATRARRAGRCAPARGRA